MIRYCFGWILICFAYTLFGQTPFICKGQYYLSLTKQGDNFSGLYEVIVDRQSGKVKLDTISSNIGLVLNGMGYRVTDNYIYGIDPLRGRLRKVGKEGVAVDLGVPQGLPPNALYYAGDITPDGRYLLVAGIGNSAANLVWIDLEDALFSTKTVLLSDANVRIVDMAFDPYSGLLFAHDLAASRMITIDPTTGIINANFLRQPAVDQLGALFFDVFGNLYGYGSYQSLVQDKFVSIDKITGAITLLGQGPTSTGQDGCACPYSIQLQKEVQPDTATVCTYVNYTFTFYNGSGITNQDVLFSDTLPQGLIWDKIVTLPYKGRVRISEFLLSFWATFPNLSMEV